MAHFTKSGQRLYTAEQVQAYFNASFWNTGLTPPPGWPLTRGLEPLGRFREVFPSNSPEPVSAC